jgi:hypothetical protein
MIRQTLLGYKDGYVDIHCRFRPNGSSAISNSLNKGHGITVAYSATGAYLATYADYIMDVITFFPSLSLAAADDKIIMGGAISASGKTAYIYMWDISGAGAADITSNANNWIHVNSTVKVSNH